jgi:hypothetical protein
MTVQIARARTVLPGIALALTVGLACTEPVTNRFAAGAPAPQLLSAQLLVSDLNPSVGAALTVYVQLTGTPAATVASFTARLQYDTTSLRYVGDTPVADSAMRVTNAMPALIRSAGISRKGFGGGLLVAYQFVALRPGPVAEMKLTFDELHTTTHSNALAALVLVPRLGVQRP